MKREFFSIIILFFAITARSQNFVATAAPGEDATKTLQAAFNDAAIKTVTVNKGDMIVNGTLTIPQGKRLSIQDGGRLTGSGTINGGDITAGYQNQIFDTTLTVNPRSVNEYFSVKWFGARGNTGDDYNAIQKAITTCIRNNIKTVYFPAGHYNISRPLLIRGASGTKDNDNNGSRAFCTLELLGQSTFWDSNMGSEIFPTFNDAFAIGIQNGKGCKIHKLRIAGLFKPPFGNNSKAFYGSSFDNFTDGKSRDSRYSPYAAIVIDPFTNLATDKLPADGGYPTMKAFYGKSGSLATQSGSTGTELEELNISGFVVGICSSPNGLTRNAEITIINKVQFSNCKLCISGGQDQEKENLVSNIYCWGGTHTIFATALYGSPRMAGNWHIDHVNIAGGVARFIYNDQHGYFPTYVSHVFAESLGSFGTFNSELACEVSDCSIDFAYQSEAGVQNLLTSYGANVVFRSCNFRYYGANTPLLMDANCTFDHCFFSGPVTKVKNGLFNFTFIFSEHFLQTTLVAFLFILIFTYIIFIFCKKYFYNKMLKRQVQ